MTDLERRLYARLERRDQEIERLRTELKALKAGSGPPWVRLEKAQV